MLRGAQQRARTSFAMSCTDFRDDLSLHADGALESNRATLLRQHLRECGRCASEVNKIQSVRLLLAQAGRVPPPADLALAIRVRWSRESHMSLLEKLWVRIENMMEPVAIPALAGVFSALLMFGGLINTFAMPPITYANDVPLVSLNSPPRLLSMTPMEMNTGEEGLLLRVKVDEGGRILDFTVLNRPEDPKLMAKLRASLLFVRFEPATSFGIPRQGTVVLNYSYISVKG